jgi:hypothetical protein
MQYNIEIDLTPPWPRCAKEIGRYAKEMCDKVTSIGIPINLSY